MRKRRAIKETDSSFLWISAGMGFFAGAQHTGTIGLEGSQVTVATQRFDLKYAIFTSLMGWGIGLLSTKIFFDEYKKSMPQERVKKQEEQKRSDIFLSKAPPDPAYQADEDTPSEYVCFITTEIMQDPIYVSADGRAYERQELQKWYDSGKRCCPIKANAPLQNPKFLPTDEKLRKKIQSYIKNRVQNEKNGKFSAIAHKN